DGPVGNQRLAIVLESIAIQVVKLADLDVGRGFLDLEIVSLAFVITETKISAVRGAVVIDVGQPDFVFAAGIGRVIEGNELDGNGAAVVAVLRAVGMRTRAGGAGENSVDDQHLPATDVISRKQYFRGRIGDLEVIGPIRKPVGVFILRAAIQIDRR